MPSLKQGKQLKKKEKESAITILSSVYFIKSSTTVHITSRGFDQNGSRVCIFIGNIIGSHGCFLSGMIFLSIFFTKINLTVLWMMSKMARLGVEKKDEKLM